MSCGGSDDCPKGEHDGGDGACVPSDICSNGYDLDGSGDCSLQFISIPAGRFKKLSDPYANPDYLLDKEIFVDAFKLSKTPTTVAQFEKCVSSGKMQ